jgi:NAD(P)-dependent dehydrogenase (short-subunit alcohol dehydrogenase family)
MGVALSQMYPAAATFTEKNVPSQKGKVFIVSGGYSGVGLELVKILYATGAKVYVAGRTEQKARDAIEKITSTEPGPTNPGQLEFLFIDLNDLTTIKPAVQEFKSKETRLDVLWNNAGVSQMPSTELSKQGFEPTLATNCYGTFLFTQLLLPTLEDTAKESQPGAVRVVWLGSQMIDYFAPHGGFSMDSIRNPGNDSTANYTNSKTGGWFLASELARRAGSKGLISVCLNPGNLNTDILRRKPWMYYMVSWWLLHPPIKGAHVELFSGLSPQVATENEKLKESGGYIIPPGRFHPEPRKDLLDAMKSKEEGGTGLASEFWNWCGDKTKDYA